MPVPASLLALQSLAIIPPDPGPSTNSSTAEDEDDLLQEHSSWALVCPTCSTPSLATHFSTAAGHRGSSSGGGAAGSSTPAVLWALGSLQPGVFAGAFCGVPVQLRLSSCEVSGPAAPEGVEGTGSGTVMTPSESRVQQGPLLTVPAACHGDPRWTVAASTSCTMLGLAAGCETAQLYPPGPPLASSNHA